MRSPLTAVLFLLAGGVAAEQPTAPVPAAPAAPPAAKAAAPAPRPAAAPATPLPATAPAASSGPEPAKPRLTLQADKGFFDDPIALDWGARRAAVIRTDSASFARLDVIDLETGKAQLSFEIGSPAQTFEQLHFAPEGKGVVLVTRDPATGKAQAQYFDPTGKAAGMAGPVTEFAPSILGSERVLIGVDRKDDTRAGTSVNNVAAYRLDGLARIGKARLHKIEKDGALKGADLHVISWFDGFSKIFARRPGKYDKARDVRLPEKSAVYDTLQGTIVSEAEIGDVYAWALISRMRGGRPNRTAFVVQNENESAVELVDAMGRRHPIPLAVPFALYDFRTLREQEGTEPGQHYFSLNVDPVNRAAVARQKADKPFLDLYAIALATNQTVHRARIPLDDRPAAWVAAYGRIAVLKKHKGFSRGGREIEIYDLR